MSLLIDIYGGGDSDNEIYNISNGGEYKHMPNPDDYKTLNLTEEEQIRMASENSLMENYLKIDSARNYKDNNSAVDKDNKPYKYADRYYDVNDLNSQINDKRRDELNKLKTKLDEEKKSINIEKDNLDQEERRRQQRLQERNEYNINNFRMDNLQSTLNRNIIKRYDQEKEDRILRIALGLLPPSYNDSYIKSELENKIEDIIKKQLEREQKGSTEKSESELVQIIKSLLNQKKPKSKKNPKSKKKSNSKKKPKSKKKSNSKQKTKSKKK
jgi:hypothetical protein